MLCQMYPVCKKRCDDVLCIFEQRLTAFESADYDNI